MMKELIEGWRILVEDVNVLDMNEKKKPVPYCEPGNPFHDENGRFTDPDEKKGSMSSGYWSTTNKKGCRKGKMKRNSANRSTQIAVKPCGRIEADNPNKKAKHRCKDGKALWESDGDHFRVHKNDIKRFILTELENVVRELDENTGSGNKCITWNQFLLAVNNLNKSLKGELKP
jgi:hypothetical protein